MGMVIDRCFHGLLFCMFLSFAFIEAIHEDTIVSSLPGFNGTFPSNQYAGYVTIDGDKNLFYYFVESERNPSEDPVVLWLNGGPGCSSFDGFVYEHGPFNFEPGQPNGSLPILHLNPYSWSTVSNIIYLDSPVGVGLSYSQNESNYNIGDYQTAEDTHSFLLQWFEEYSEFFSNPFYLSGESYAGVYVPTLASQVVAGIQAGVVPNLNFKGYMVGNGVTDPMYDGNALVPFVHGMGLISDDIYQNVVAACNGSYYNNNDPNCDASYQTVMNCFNGLNIYDILEPCYHGSDSVTSLPVSFKQLGATERPLPVRKRMFGRAWPYWAPAVEDGPVTLWPQLDSQSGVPCVSDEVATIWLNNPAVREAIHAQPVSVAGPWEICTTNSNFNYNHDAGSMIPYHVNLTNEGYRALIFSGDHDMCVPFTGSEAWTRSLGYAITDPWRSWLSVGQVAGYLQGYAHNLTFITVKGAGHTVAEYKPQQALAFFSRWLEGTSI
ncbi:Peptidase_S10 domain-containing protein [Cephalotus follicularis]|uniref:Carboxypeptidase n=1 Tax=Cephalotus follicularis TaxID=3775 RepID=A0A1Q3AYT0_CEPFO|nr:Peptidase_S10 domain-containing protein [Cephalotus follicularis]